jgi:outer membrane protein assembly factor BamB
VSAAGGVLTIVGFFLPWVTLVAIAVIGCRGPLQIVMVTLTAWHIAGGAAGLRPAVATWLLLLMALLIIGCALRMFVDRRRTLRRARLIMVAAVVALVDAGVQSYLWVGNMVQARTGPGVNTVFSSIFQGFGRGLWVIVSGLLTALAGGAVLHGAARSPGRRLPLPETALVVASLLALAGSGGAALGIVPFPSLATVTVACHGSGEAARASSPRSLYAAVQQTVYALGPGDGTVRWQCRNSFVNLQTAGPPTLADDTVYVAALDGSAFAVRADDGVLLWHRAVATRSPYYLGFGSFGATALVAADGAIYGKDGSGGVFALRAADGAELWHNTSLGIYQASVGGTALVVAGGVIYGAPDYLYGAIQGLFALDARTGALLWRASASSLWRAGFAVAGGRIYDEEIEFTAAVGRTYLVARAASDGTLVWRYPLAVAPPGPLPPASAFTVADGVIYLQTYEPVGSPEILTPVVRALRATDGMLLWSFDPLMAPEEGQAFGGNGVTVVAGTVYAAVGTLTNSVYSADIYALSTRDGAPLWHMRPFPSGLSADQSVVQSPLDMVVASGTAYIVAPGRNLAAIDMRDGSLRWTYGPMVAHGSQAQLPVSATPVVVSGDLVYLAADRLYAIYTRGGSVRWQLAAPHRPSQGTAITFSAPALGP